MLTVDELVARVDRGERLEYLCFWGHTPKTPGVIDKSCLSQWYPSEFSDGEHEYPTAEHYMMYGKARLFGDQDTAAKILEADTPSQAKKLGRQVRGFDDKVWIQKRFDLIVTGNFLKFSQNSEMRAFLLGTGSKILVEASPEDKIWGIGMLGGDPRASDPRQWQGKNLLGFALMDVRAKL